MAHSLAITPSLTGIWTVSHVFLSEWFTRLILMILIHLVFVFLASSQTLCLVGGDGFVRKEGEACEGGAIGQFSAPTTCGAGCHKTG